jgi:hypothetical protein
VVKKSFAALYGRYIWVAIAYGVRTGIFLTSATILSFLASGGMTLMVVRFSFGGPAFSLSSL